MRAKFVQTGRLLSALGLIAVLLFAYVPAGIVYAAINSCSASVFQHSVPQGSVANLQFQITNIDSSAIRWIKISVPSDNFVIISANISPWSGDARSDTATFTGGSIDRSATNDQIYMDVNPSTAAPSADWTIQVSDNSSGTNPFNCSGALGTAITAPAPIVSNIAVGNISSNSVTVSWDSDVDSTSQVNYGSDDSYGKSSALDSTPASSHSVKLSNLSANTSYHFQVISTTPDGGTGSSGDNTFLTAVEQAGLTKTITLPGLAVQVTNPGDKTPPTIQITSNLPKIVQTTPVIKGTASDDLAVIRIEYSTDGGQNWLPVDNAPKLGGKAVDFSFTPANLDDGDYTILARAIDAGGNIAATPPVTVVIDRLQPIVGGSVINLGPQILKPNDNGVINTTVGVDQKISLSAIGGPTSITLSATPINTNHKTNNFSLTQSSDTGLWQGVLSFGEPGDYSLTASATDGAGNKTSRVLANIQVSSAGKIVKKGTNQAIKGAKLTVYSLETESNSWRMWDGASYGQTNPQTTDKTGEFNLFLPVGKYYLKTSAPGYKTLTSDSFTINGPTPISTILALQPTHHLGLGWLNLSTQKITLNASGNTSGSKTNSLIGKQIPTFSLYNLDGKRVNSLDWLAKPTLISLNATWSPETIDQLKVLQQMQSSQNYNVISIGLEQTASQLDVYDGVFGLSLNWLPDPDGTLASTLNAQALPTNYFVDRTGVIRHVTSGILTKQQIVDGLTGL